MTSINKVIIPLGGLGTRFLPLSKVVSKEMWPLVGRPMVEYIVEEAKNSGANHINFVVKPGRNMMAEYFRRTPSLEKLIQDKKQDKKKEKLLGELRQPNVLVQDIKLSFAVQDSPLGDGHAILQAKRFAGKEPCGVLFTDDIVISKTPCLAQLAKVFKTCQRPVLALKKVSQDRIGKYGVVETERIAAKLYKIKKIVEKPDPQLAPSDLAIVGKYIITHEVFEYLSKTKSGLSGEILLADALNQMIADGKAIYGYEFEGEWLECGDKEGWMRANLRLALEYPEYRKEIRKYIK